MKRRENCIDLAFQEEEAIIGNGACRTHQASLTVLAAKASEHVYLEMSVLNSSRISYDIRESVEL